MTRALPLAIALTLLCLAGCGPEPNSLSGSISQNFDLGFDTTRFVRINGATFQLDYLRDFEDGTQSVICKLVFDEPDSGVELEEDIDILANDGKAERVAGDGDLPGLESGVIRFFAYEEPGEGPGAVEGEFALTFEDGKTLNGTFDTPFEDVEL